MMLYIICIAIILFFSSFLQMLIGEGLNVIYLSLLGIIIAMQIITITKIQKNKDKDKE